MGKKKKVALNLSKKESIDDTLAARFKDTRLPVYSIPFEVDLVEHFPVLQRYEAFLVDTISNQLRDQYIRFAVYAYDHHSPLQQDVNDDLERQIEAAEMAGFSRDEEGVFDDPNVQLFISNAYDETPLSNIVFQYISQLQDSDEWASYCLTRRALYSIQQQLWNDVSVTSNSKAGSIEDVLLKRDKLSDAIDKYNKKLSDLSKKLFKGSASAERKAKEEAYIWTPEYVARMTLHDR